MSEWGSTADLDMADHHGRKAAPLEQAKPARVTVRLVYTEQWRREATTEVVLDDVRDWAGRRDGVDPADVELTSDVLADYLQEEYDGCGPDLPGWHARGEGLKGYEFDHLDVQTAEVTE